MPYKHALFICIYYIFVSASDIVKKMFTLQFLPHKETTSVKRDKVLKLVKRHRLDRKSPEALSNV